MTTSHKALWRLGIALYLQGCAQGVTWPLLGVGLGAASAYWFGWAVWTVLQVDVDHD